MADSALSRVEFAALSRGEGTSLTLGPLDGRYREAVAPLIDFLSEAALNRDRVHVEVEWLIH
ncbi:adenylosuccinate lyase, partial [Arthrobacter agilis]